MKEMGIGIVYTQPFTKKFNDKIQYFTKVLGHENHRKKTKVKVELLN